MADHANRDYIFKEIEEFEFARGDILMEICGRNRYVVSDTEKHGYVVNYEDGMIARASKSWLERNFVKVGEWDFDVNEERD